MKPVQQIGEKAIIKINTWHYPSSEIEEMINSDFDTDYDIANKSLRQKQVSI